MFNTLVGRRMIFIRFSLQPLLLFVTVLTAFRNEQKLLLPCRLARTVLVAATDVSWDPLNFLPVSATPPQQAAGPACDFFNLSHLSLPVTSVLLHFGSTKRGY
jgi:hypothetical protein